jgi:hypothetical protein
MGLCPERNKPQTNQTHHQRRGIKAEVVEACPLCECSIVGKQVFDIADG